MLQENMILGKSRFIIPAEKDARKQGKCTNTFEHLCLLKGLALAR